MIVEAAPTSSITHHVAVGGAGITLTTDSFSSSLRRYVVARESVGGGVLRVLDMLLLSLGALLNLPAVANANIFETEEALIFATVPGSVVPYVQSWYNTLFERPYVVAWTESVSPSLFWSALLVAVVIARVLLRLSGVQRQEVVAMRGVGVQVTNYSVTGAVVSRKFIDKDLIRSVFIHEGYFRHQAVFFLGIVVENEDRITVLFDETLPLLPVLRIVLCGIHHVLYQENDSQGPSLAELGASSITNGEK
jgi:hypothetical protein